MTGTSTTGEAAKIAEFIEGELTAIGHRFDEAVDEQEHDELFEQYTAYKKVMAFITHEVMGVSSPKETEVKENAVTL